MNPTRILRSLPSAACLALLAILGLRSPDVSAQTGWYWQNPLPQGNDLFGVSAISPSVVVAVGANGTIIRTPDGGSTWTVRHRVGDVSTSLKSVSFSDELNGWAVGEAGVVLKTTDGGGSWLLRSNIPLRRNLNEVLAFGSTVTVVGDSGTIVQSTNGGSTWAVLPIATTHDLQAVFFSSPTTGYVVGEGGFVARTDVGGASWNPSVSPHVIGNLLSLWFFADTGWVVGLFQDSSHVPHNMLLTTDGGQTWTPQNTESTVRLHTLVFPDRRKAFALDESHVVATINGGRTWAPRLIDSLNTFSGISFSDTSNGWMVGSSGEIRKTTDGGSSWNRVSVGLQFDLHAIAAASGSRLIAVGDGGAITRTDNGGDNWFPIASPTQRNLQSVDFFTSNAGVAVGDGGEIIRTVDGGLSWSEVSNGSFSLSGVQFFDATNGWAVGFNGSAYRSTDAGAHWTLRPILDSAHLPLVDSSFAFSSVFFATPLAGFISANKVDTFHVDTVVFLRNRTMIFSTGDGGSTWHRPYIDSVSGSTLLSVYFLDPNVGWAVGTPRRILKTTDGGIHWIPQAPAARSGSQYFDVRFTDRNNGWIVGLAGTILRTANGGANWYLQSSDTRRELLGIVMADSLTGWVCGAGGTIFRTNDGGGPIQNPPPPPPVVKPQPFGLASATPDPFLPSVNGSLYLPFTVVTPGEVTLEIFDIQGRLILRKSLGFFAAGSYCAPLDTAHACSGFAPPAWDGKDQYGNPAASGVYFYRVSTRDFITPGRFVLLR